MAQAQVLNTFWLPEQFADKTGRVTVETAHAAVAGGSSNAVVVTGVSGKRILVLHAVVGSQGGLAVCVFKSNSGGRTLMNLNINDRTLATDPQVQIGPSPYGIMHCDLSHSLVVDNAAVGILITVNYILYTP